MTELIKCDCGLIPKLYKLYDFWWVVECECGKTTEDSYCDKDKATEAWNRRESK